MKFAKCFFVLACVCAMVVANPHGNAKHQSRKAAEKHEKASKSASITSESARSMIDSGADTLSRAIDVLTPLARNTVSLGSDLASRLYNGGSNSKQGRANDASLWARIDKTVADAASAYKGAVSSALSERISERIGAAKAAAAAAKAKISSAISALRGGA